MKKELAYVIKDSQGNYPTLLGFALTDDGWMYTYVTGIITGFRFYTNKVRAEEVLDQLNKTNDKYGFDKEFSIDYIDVDSIEMGESIFEDIA